MRGEARKLPACENALCIAFAGMHCHTAHACFAWNPGPRDNISIRYRNIGFNSHRERGAGLKTKMGGVKNNRAYNTFPLGAREWSTLSACEATTFSDPASQKWLLQSKSASLHVSKRLVLWNLCSDRFPGLPAALSPLRADAFFV